MHFVWQVECQINAMGPSGRCKMHFVWQVGCQINAMDPSGRCKMHFVWQVSMFSIVAQECCKVSCSNVPFVMGLGPGGVVTMLLLQVDDDDAENSSPAMQETPSPIWNQMASGLKWFHHDDANGDDGVVVDEQKVDEIATSKETLPFPLLLRPCRS